MNIYPIIFLVFFVCPVVGLSMITLATRSARPGRCGICHYDMRGLPRFARCPECGTGRHPGSRGLAIRSRLMLNLGIMIFMTPFIIALVGLLVLLVLPALR